MKKISENLTLKVSVCTFALLLALMPSAALAAATPDLSIQEWLEVGLTNEARFAEGVKPLSVQAAESQAAATRALEIERSFAHTRPSGENFYTALQRAGATYRTAGENIAEGYASPTAVHVAWMNSPGHRRNILNPNYDTMGVGLHTSNSRYGSYWAQQFTGSNKTPVSISVDQGNALQNGSPTANSPENIDKLIVVLTVKYSDNSIGYAPVTKSMVEGYRPNYSGTQTVKVNFGSASMPLTISGAMAETSTKSQVSGAQYTYSYSTAQQDYNYSQYQSRSNSEYIPLSAFSVFAAGSSNAIRR
ncbi:MAG: CAP domain-containing protein [Eubacteriaceae bacterium]|nr:CAP domain-containing protein [Eubacteriaceae bacterium]